MRLLVASRDESLIALVSGALRRFQYELRTVPDGLAAFQALVREPFDLALLDYDLSPTTALDLLLRLETVPAVRRPPAIVFVRTEGERGLVEAAALSRTEVASAPVPPRALVDRVGRILRERIRIACLGGGTGLFTLLRGLKTLPGVALTSIVSMSDDGGSTGRLRVSFGVLPPGDVRRSLIALSSAPDLLNDLMSYRFTRGGELTGHNLGNLILTALAEMRGSMTAAVRALGEILGIEGEVVPVTEGETTLMAELGDGTVLSGETRIDRPTPGESRPPIRRVWLDPPVSASEEALGAIRDADLVVLGPGDLFTSVLANLVVGGVPEAIAASRAATLFVVNVMTKPGETDDFSVADHVREVRRYLPGLDLDHVLCSSTRFSPEALATYASEGQVPVAERPEEDLLAVTGARIHRADVASEAMLVRHDSLKLARAMREILDEAALRRPPRVEI